MKRRSLVPAAVSLAVIGCGGSGGGGIPVPAPPPCSSGLETPRAFEGITGIVSGAKMQVGVRNEGRTDIRVHIPVIAKILSVRSRCA